MSPSVTHMSLCLCSPLLITCRTRVNMYPSHWNSHPRGCAGLSVWVWILLAYTFEEYPLSCKFHNSIFFLFNPIKLKIVWKHNFHDYDRFAVLIPLGRELIPQFFFIIYFTLWIPVSIPHHTPGPHGHIFLPVCPSDLGCDTTAFTGTVFLSFLVDVMTSQSLRKQGFILAHSSRHRPSHWGSQGSSSWKQLIMWHLQSGEGKVSPLVPSSHFQGPVREWCHTQWRVFPQACAEGHLPGDSRLPR